MSSRPRSPSFWTKEEKENRISLRSLTCTAPAAGSPPWPVFTCSPNGTGSITINGRDIDDYFGLDTLQMAASPSPWI